MTLGFGDVVLIRIDFHQTAGAKVRPAVVVLDAGDEDFVAAPITSRERNSTWEFPLRKWQTAGLNVGSFARIHKLAVQPKADVARKLGSLAPEDSGRLRKLPCDAYCGETSP